MTPIYCVSRFETQGLPASNLNRGYASARDVAPYPFLVNYSRHIKTEVPSQQPCCRQERYVSPTAFGSQLTFPTLRMTDRASSPTVLCDVETLLDIPLGELHQIAEDSKFSKKAKKAAKFVLKTRLEQLARGNKVQLGRRIGRCLFEHSTSTGVNPGKAGIIWVYVSGFFVVRSLHR